MPVSGRRLVPLPRAEHQTVKVKDYCGVCGLVKNATPHVRDHEFVPTVDRPRFGQQRQSLPKRSERMERYYEEVRRPAVAEAVGKPCEVRSPKCTGTATTLHEPATRARSGGLVPAVAAGGEVPSCASCNTWISQDAEGIRWATAAGLLLPAPPSLKVVPRRRPPPEQRPDVKVRRMR